MHEAEISASCREEVFEILKTSGIRPCRVNEAPGALNKLLGKGKRWMAIAVLMLLVLGLLFARTTTRSFDESNLDVRVPRHQIYGDPALMEEVSRNHYEKVFSSEGERLLADFAVPGMIPSKIDTRWKISARVALDSMPAGDVPCDGEEKREVRELKQIVNWMKAEYFDFIRCNETSAEYVERLIARQKEEIEILSRTRRQLLREKNPLVWEEKNAALRNIGLPTIPASSIE